MLVPVSVVALIVPPLTVPELVVVPVSVVALIVPPLIVPVNV